MNAVAFEWQASSDLSLLLAGWPWQGMFGFGGKMVAGEPMLDLC